MTLRKLAGRLAYVGCAIECDPMDTEEKEILRLDDRFESLWTASLNDFIYLSNCQLVNRFLNAQCIFNGQRPYESNSGSKKKKHCPLMFQVWCRLWSPRMQHRIFNTVATDRSHTPAEWLEICENYSRTGVISKALVTALFDGVWARASIHAEPIRHHVAFSHVNFVWQTTSFFVIYRLLSVPNSTSRHVCRFFGTFVWRKLWFFCFRFVLIVIVIKLLLCVAMQCARHQKHRPTKSDWFWLQYINMMEMCRVLDMAPVAAPAIKRNTLRAFMTSLWLFHALQIAYVILCEVLGWAYARSFSLLLLLL